MQKDKSDNRHTSSNKKEFVRRLRKLQAKMAPHARNIGIHTDQDVFDRVS